MDGHSPDRQAKPDRASTDLAIITTEGIPNPLSSIEAAAELAGLRVARHTQPSIRVEASLDWLSITAFVLALINPVYTDLYHVWLNRHAPALWRRFFDPANPDRIIGKSLGGKRKPPLDYSRTFSIWEPFQHGRVTLLFPNDCSDELFQRAIAKFAKLMQAYAAGQTYEGIDLDREEDRYWGTILVAYNESHDRLEILNPFLRAGVSTSAIENQRNLERRRRSRAKRPANERVEPTIGQPPTDD